VRERPVEAADDRVAAAVVVCGRAIERPRERRVVHAVGERGDLGVPVPARDVRPERHPRDGVVGVAEQVGGVDRHLTNC
jgi:hypothetical protein